MLPTPLQRRLRPEHVPTLPPKVNHFVGLALEALNALRYRDAETANYLRFYAMQFPRQVRGAMGDAAKRRVRGERRTDPGFRRTAADRLAAPSRRTIDPIDPIDLESASPAGSVPTGATAVSVEIASKR